MKQKGRKKIRNLEDKGNCAMGDAMGGVCRTSKFDICLHNRKRGLYVQAIPWLLKRSLL